MSQQTLGSGRTPAAHLRDTGCWIPGYPEVGMVLSEIWCPRKKSTNFGTFDLLSLICVRVQAYFSKLERTNLFWYAFEVGKGYLTKFKFRLLILVIR